MNQNILSAQIDIMNGIQIDLAADDELAENTLLNRLML
jgi:hypothetical protein